MHKTIKCYPCDFCPQCARQPDKPEFIYQFKQSDNRHEFYGCPLAAKPQEGQRECLSFATGKKRNGEDPYMELMMVRDELCFLGVVLQEYSPDICDFPADAARGLSNILGRMLPATDGALVYIEELQSSLHEARAKGGRHE